MSREPIAISMKELLERVGQPDQIQNSKLTRAIAQKLSAKGYVRRRVKGVWMWIKEPEVLNVEEIATEAVRGL